MKVKSQLIDAQLEARGSAPTKRGEILINTASSNQVQYYDGSTNRTVVNTDQAQTLSSKTLTSPVLNTGVSGSAVLDEDTMSSDSDTQLATQQSIKAYADGKIAKSTATTKGDVLVATGSGVVTRLGVGTDGQVLTADSAQTEGVTWSDPASAPGSANDLSNLGLSASVAANALTIALKQSDGSTDPSTGGPVKIGFRDATNANGNYDLVSATSAVSVTVSSGSTLGHTSGAYEYIYVYAINNAGSIELAVSSSFYDSSKVVSTSAEGGAGAADSATALYSTSARSNVALRYLGHIQITQATAGTWASGAVAVKLGETPQYKLGSQQIFTSNGTWTRPQGCKAVKVTVIGGGGGGGGAASNAAEGAASGGGGAGGLSIKFITKGLGTSESVSVGGGGAGGNTSGSTGGTGSTSSFGSHCSATGGSGGTAQSSGTSLLRGGTPGIGGTGSSGDINIYGGCATWPIRLAASSFVASNGGDGYLGTGGRGNSAVGSGANGNVYGGGGGGSTSYNASNHTGGDGADGVVIVEEYY